jgi:hypothetical protein
MTPLSSLLWRWRLRSLKNLEQGIVTVRTYTPHNFDRYLRCISHDPADHKNLWALASLPADAFHQ